MRGGRALHQQHHGPSSYPTKSAIVDAQGLAAAEHLLARLRDATRPPTVGGDPGGPARSVPNALELHRRAYLLLEELGTAKAAMLRRQAEGRASAAAAGAPYRGVQVAAADEKFADGVANFLTIPGADRAMQITGVPPEFEAKEARSKLCNDAQKMGMTAETKECVCAVDKPWAVCAAMMYKEGKVVQTEQANEAIDWSAPNPPPLSRTQRTLLAEEEAYFGSGFTSPAEWSKGTGSGSVAEWLEPAEFGQAVASVVADSAAGRQLLAKKTKCKFRDILGIFTERCGGFQCNFPLPPPPGKLLTLKVAVDACLPVVEILPNALKFCTAGERDYKCVEEAEATYAAAQAASQFAELSKASITIQLCLKLGKLKKVVKWLGLDGVCGGPTISWWPVKEQLQFAQGVTAIIARLDVGGLLHYGNSTENSMCNFFRNARSQNAWNWHMKCQDFCAWQFGSGKIDVGFMLNLLFWQETWTWTVVESDKPACDQPPQECSPGEFTDRANGNACTKCPAGTWSGATRTFSCNPCPAGTFGKWAGAMTSATCHACPAGSYAASEGSRTCDPCRLGSFNPYEGAGACLSCPPGSYGVVEGKASKADACKNAPPGHYTHTEGATQPLPCDKGYVQPLEGQTTCHKCVVEGGKISPNPGGTQCVPCPAGSFQLTHYSCKECWLGAYQDQAGTPGWPPEGTCKKCQPGSFANVTGSTACTLCAAGYFQGSCCSASCNACPPLTVAPSPGATECTSCPLGSKFVNASSPCEACLPGTVGEEDRRSCRSCPAGSYQDQAGATKCIDCPLRSVAPQPGSAKCTECPPGQFAWDFSQEYMSNEKPRTICHDKCPAGMLRQIHNGRRKCCLTRFCFDVGPAQ